MALTITYVSLLTTLFIIPNAFAIWQDRKVA